MVHLIEPDARVYIASYIAACGALVPRDDADRQIANAVAHDCPACLAVAADDLETTRQLGERGYHGDVDRIDDSDTAEAEREFENGDDDTDDTDDEDDVDDDDDDLIDEL
jgi:hypothetical protein